MTVLRAGLLLLGAALAGWAEHAPVKFDWDDRWQHYLRRTYSSERLMLLAADTAVEQVLSPGSCGRGPQCLSSAYSAAFARRVPRTTIELGAGLLFQEDIRRRASNKTGFGPRLAYALKHSMMAYGPNGECRFAFSRVAAVAGGVAIASTWQNRPLTGGLVAQGLAGMFVTSIQDTLLVEFEGDLRRFGARLGKRWWSLVVR